MADQSPDSTGPVIPRIAVRLRKRVEVKSRRPAPTDAADSGSPNADGLETSHEPASTSSERPAAQPADEGNGPEPVNAAAAAPSFRSLEVVPYEPAPWQAPGLLKKTGLVVLITPPGACCFSLCAYLAAYLAGRAYIPFGPARYPGDVLFSSYTPGLERSMRAAISSTYPGAKKILTHQSSSRFNWKSAAATVRSALSNQASGETSALIIDTGPFPHRLKDDVVDTASTDLTEIAEKEGCLIVLVVESTSQHGDPFERIPKGLRLVRGTLLAAPMRSKTLAPQPGDPAEFLLIRLAEGAPYSLAIRFTLRPVLDNPEAANINWGTPGWVNPREVFRRCDTMDLTDAQRTAVQLAADIIRQNGPTSSRDLQAAGKHLRGIAPTTMRDALSVAKLLGHLNCARNMFDSKSYWIIPGVTQLPSGMYVPNAIRDDQLPF